MKFLIDIGNSNIVYAVVKDDATIFTRRTESLTETPETEYLRNAEKMFADAKVNPKEIAEGMISSVVPALTEKIKNVAQTLTGKRMAVVGPGSRLGFDIGIDAGAILGSDLICNIAAVKANYPMPAVIIDMGTATTMTVLDAAGMFKGMTISPGAGISLAALSARAAQLPEISLDCEPVLFGNNTVECMRAGILLGNAAMIDGMVANFAAELSAPPTVILTGGFGRLVAPHCKTPVILDRNLLLNGLSLLCDLAKG